MCGAAQSSPKPLRSTSYREYRKTCEVSWCGGDGGSGGDAGGRDDGDGGGHGEILHMRFGSAQLPHESVLHALGSWDEQRKYELSGLVCAKMEDHPPQLPPPPTPSVSQTRHCSRLHETSCTRCILQFGN